MRPAEPGWLVPMARIANVRCLSDIVAGSRPDPFYDHLIARAATIDELLSGDFEPVPGQTRDLDLADRRLAAWCRAAANGDWKQFEHRLRRDGLTIPIIRATFSVVHWQANSKKPDWLTDAIWIETALAQKTDRESATATHGAAYPFEQLINPIAKEAERILQSAADSRMKHFSEAAFGDLRSALMSSLCALTAPPLYERFSEARKRSANRPSLKFSYEQFIDEMKQGGFRHLFEDKPVLLRVIAVTTRNWIESSREVLQRLDCDYASIRENMFRGSRLGPVVGIKGEISDTHNNGRSVQILTFADGHRIVYKPKDLRLDAAWHNFVERINRSGPPIDLRTARVLVRDDYGWTEFIDHCECPGRDGVQRFFTRAGSWLALFHAFVANDMHQENLIASGEYPVPIDLETILQPAPEDDGSGGPEAEAFETAVDNLANSVMMVGLLPAYGRSPDNNVFAIGGLTAGWKGQIEIVWEDINSDKMRPKKRKVESALNPNLPHINGEYSNFFDYVPIFAAGYKTYAGFLADHKIQRISLDELNEFSGIPVRKILRATRFYAMLLQRLKDHRRMNDGVMWSAQADFVARLADWDHADDPLWPLQKRERAALLSLDVPYFVSTSDGGQIKDFSGHSVSTRSVAGLDRATARLRCLNKQEIGWQLEVIEANTRKASNSPVCEKRVFAAEPRSGPSPDWLGEAEVIADELATNAIRKAEGAAWIGIDCLGDAEVFQLAALGPDLYNGTAGIGVFLAAHASITSSGRSADLALAAVAHARKRLRDLNRARFVRALGIGGGVGLGSIIYALTVIAKLLRNDELRADACIAAELMSDDLIMADKRLDFMGGAAGAILGLLRLYRDEGSQFVLARAIKCGDYLLSQAHQGEAGRRCWVGQGSTKQPLNGMSHGAAGFAYAFASLFDCTGREEYASAAAECIEFENSSFDPAHGNWPDLRSSPPSWPCQWCHGAPGIGLARAAMMQLPGMNGRHLKADIASAVDSTRLSSSGLDTLCCGTLGRIEFLCTAADVLGQSELQSIAAQSLLQIIQDAWRRGDYRWNAAGRKYNVGLFRGLSGVGYTTLRRVDPTLPNILVLQ